MRRHVQCGEIVDGDFVDYGAMKEQISRAVDMIALGGHVKRCETVLQFIANSLNSFRYFFK